MKTIAGRFHLSLYSVLMVLALWSTTLSVHADCCKDIQISLTPNGTCCYDISVTGFEQCTPAITQLFIVERHYSNATYISLAQVQEYHNAFTTFLCLTPGNHDLQFILQDSRGTLVCKKTVSVSCNFNCDDVTPSFSITPTTSSDPTQCCFQLTGNAGNAYNATTFVVEKQDGSNWVGVSSGSITDAAGNFGSTFCLLKGSYTFRIRICDGQGNTICKKEVSISCEDSCCSSMHVELGLDDAATDNPETCCVVFYALYNCPNATNYEFFVDGSLFTSGVAPASIFSMSSCKPHGNHTYRFILKDAQNNVLCVRELEYFCPEHPCCESIHIQATPEDLNHGCCYRLTSPDNWRCLTVHGFAVEQLNSAGQWIPELLPTSNPSVIHNTDFNVLYCVDGNNANYVYDSNSGLFFQKIRIVFYDINGNVFCIKEVNLDCTLAGGGQGEPHLGKRSSENRVVNHAMNDTPLSNISTTPNPVHDEATISFEATNAAFLRVEICNAAGQCLVVRNDINVKRGMQSINIPMQGFSSGVYTILLKANGYTYTQSISVVR